MKKAWLIFVLLTGTMHCLYARDFNPSWVDRMSDYIGEKIDDIPYAFSAIDDGYVYVSESKSGGLFGIGARSTGEAIFANKKKVVEYAFWYMDSWLGSDEVKELADIRKEFTNKYGSPKNENDSYIWNWKKSGGFLKGSREYEIYLYRDSSDNSACVMIQKKQSGFERRWELLLKTIGVK